MIVLFLCCHGRTVRELNFKTALLLRTFLSSQPTVDHDARNNDKDDHQEDHRASPVTSDPHPPSSLHPSSFRAGCSIPDLEFHYTARRTTPGCRLRVCW